MIVYADSSFLVSSYLTDDHSPEADRRIALGHTVVITPFQRAEVANALFQWAFRGRLSVSEANLTFDDFEQDCTAGVWAIVDFPDLVFESSVELARRRVATLGVRTLDTLHVAAALELKADQFWTFDDRQARLAEAEGLATS